MNECKYPRPLPGETCEQWIARVDQWRMEKHHCIADALTETRVCVAEQPGYVALGLAPSTPSSKP